MKTFNLIFFYNWNYFETQKYYYILVLLNMMFSNNREVWEIWAHISVYPFFCHFSLLIT